MRFIVILAFWFSTAVASPGDRPRIVATSPHAAELVAAAGGSDLLVGVAAHTDRPEFAGVPAIGDAFALDRERLLSLRPDLAVVWQGGNRESDIAWLESLGIGVYRSDPRHLTDIPREIEEIGRLAGTSQTATERASLLADRIDRLSAAHANQRPVRYFFQLWHRPPMTFGANAFVTRALNTCGARNVFDGVEGKSFALDPEALASTEVDVEIIDTGLGGVAGLSRAPRILRVETDVLYRPSPALLPALERLCHALHGG